VRGKEEWSKVAPSHPTVVWHAEQSVENPAAAWFGSVVSSKSDRWHEEQSVDVPE
jgi:hypothetical protein